jgi:hypothetical protein
MCAEILAEIFVGKPNNYISKLPIYGEIIAITLSIEVVS